MLYSWQWWRERDSEAFRNEVGLWLVHFAFAAMILGIAFLLYRDDGPGRKRRRDPRIPEGPISVPEVWVRERA